MVDAFRKLRNVSFSPRMGAMTNRPDSTEPLERGAAVWYHTFGCKANQYDTERMRQELESRGAVTVDDVAEADTAVLNTCTVTETADLEAMRAVRRLARRHPRLRVYYAAALLTGGRSRGAIGRLLAEIQEADPSRPTMDMPSGRA
jgi:hypothetical protein